MNIKNPTNAIIDLLYFFILLFLILSLVVKLSFSFQPGIVALTGSLHGPLSPRVLTQRSQ
jgi:hypothetical protein